MSEEQELQEKVAWLRMCIADHLKRILELQQHKNKMKKELSETQSKLRKLRYAKSRDAEKT